MLKRLRTNSGSAVLFSGRNEKLGTAALFLITFAFVLVKLYQCGTLAVESISGDAADAWKTITSWYSGNRYMSYVLYKGMASVYPYVWLYRLAQMLGTNDFFFVMCYHAVLFSYVAVIGIPVLIQKLTGYKPKLWQKAVLVVVLYWCWDRYYVLTQMMVDLPSCAFFFLAMHCAIRIGECAGWKKWVLCIASGLLCGLCANISGQYSVAAYCILIYAAWAFWKTVKQQKKLWKIAQSAVCVAVLFTTVYAVGCLNEYFHIHTLNGQFKDQATWWMERALIYMLDKPRMFYGAQLRDMRGYEIVAQIYGAENAAQTIQSAGDCMFFWSIPTYFKAFFQYPVDFIMLYLNRVIIAISDDGGNGALIPLLSCYTLVYLTIVTACKNIKKLGDIFCENFWLVLGVLASIIPILVMTVEMRFTISLQGMLFGVALLGPLLPQMAGSVWTFARRCWQEKSLRSLLEIQFPWALLGWVVFVLVCMGYFGAIAAGSNIGSNMIYS